MERNSYVLLQLVLKIIVYQSDLIFLSVFSTMASVEGKIYHITYNLL